MPIPFYHYIPHMLEFPFNLSLLFLWARHVECVVLMSRVKALNLLGL